MRKRTGLAAAVLFLWLSLQLAMPSPAQQRVTSVGSGVPSLTIGSIQVPMWIGTKVHDAVTGPDFVAEDGILMLKTIKSDYLQTPEKVFWSGPFDKMPQNFTVLTTNTDELIEDSTGRVLWSHHYELPSLTLLLNRGTDGTYNSAGTLLNNTGQVLWSGQLPLLEREYKPLKDPNQTMVVRSRFLYTYRQDQATLMDARGNILWTGSPSGNTGLRVEDLGGRGWVETFGIPGPMMPAGKALTLLLTSTERPIVLMDSRQNVLAEPVVPVVKMTLTSNNDLINGFFEAGTTLYFPGIQVSTAQPGPVTALFHNDFGRVIKTQTFDHGRLVSMQSFDPQQQ